MNSNQKAKNQRRRMYEKSGGQCFWCERLTILPECVPEGSLKRPSDIPQLATIDHLDDRFSKERGKRRHEMRHVLACWGCNQWRSHRRVEKHKDIQIAVSRGDVLLADAMRGITPQERERRQQQSRADRQRMMLDRRGLQAHNPPPTANAIPSMT